MAPAITPEVHIADDASALASSCAEALIESIDTVVRDEGICSIVLAGGSTPMPVYRLLAGDLRDHVPWDRLHLFWGDERFVPRTSSQSNYAAVAEIIRPLALHRAQIHPIPVDQATPEEAARAYEHELRLWFTGSLPDFDITILGLGADGHTASLFPDDEALRETERWVTHGIGPDAPMNRMTLTFPVLNASGEVHFIVTGDGKRGALRKMLHPDEERIPASYIRPDSGRLIVWADAAAAADLG